MLIGLTGGIACGKSTVLSIFRELGWSTYDADQICHNIYDRKQTVLTEMFSERWGAARILTSGKIDRSRVADIVFSDKAELAWLNGIFHPFVFEELNSAAAADSDVIFDIPLLYEAGWEDNFEKIIAVWSDAELQIRRLTERGLDTDQAQARINSQIPGDKKLEMADYALINNYGLAELKEQVINISNKLKR